MSFHVVRSHDEYGCWPRGMSATRDGGVRRSMRSAFANKPRIGVRRRHAPTKKTGPFFLGNMRDLLGDGIFNADGALWSSH